MAVAAFNALEQIAGRETELARALHAQFRRRLTIEDVRDAVADALVVAHQSRADLEALSSEQLEAWVRTRAYRNAIDQIRAIDGYGADKRKSSVSVDDYAETLPDPEHDPLQGLDDELAERYADGAAARSVALALDRLTPDERRLLRLRHYDGLDVKTIAELLDIHPKKYERLHTRAVAKLRTIFIETTAGENCPPVRTLIARSRREALTPELSAEIAAHVESCEQCRAYEKRSLKLIAMLPLPAPALADRIWSRLSDLGPTVGGHGDSIAASATGTAAAGAGAGAGAAGAGGTTAGTGILAGLGAKAVAICAGTAVTATCVGVVAVPVIKHRSDPDPPKREARRQAPRASTTPVAARPLARLASTAATTTPRTATSKRATPKTPRVAPLGIEDFGTPTGGGATATAPPPPPPPPPSSTFSGEFTP